MSDIVSVYEVGLRDGLQNEAQVLTLNEKSALLAALVDANIQKIELSSFVSPKWIPQLSDADAFVAISMERYGVKLGNGFVALCPNMQGLERAKITGINSIAVFLSASEGHSKKNINKTIDEALAQIKEVCKAALGLNMNVRGYISTVFGCPYDGEVPLASVNRIACALVEAGCHQVSLGDTIGVAVPKDVGRILSGLDIPLSKVALHMHDTRGTALANVVKGLEMGVRTFDASIAGLGGCPYAKGASGNLATEDLVYLVEGMGLETGIKKKELQKAGQLAQTLLKRSLPGKVFQAGFDWKRSTPHT